MRDGGRKERRREGQTREATFCFSSHKAQMRSSILRPPRLPGAQETTGGPPQSPSNPACSQDAQR